MALLWHKEKGIWSRRTNDFSYKEGSEFKKLPTYYKHQGKWNLLKSPPAIEWPTAELLQLNTVEDFSEYVNDSFKEYGITKNNITKSGSYLVDNTYGINCQYAETNFSNYPVLFSTGPMLLPYRIVLDATLAHIGPWYMAHMALYLTESKPGDTLYNPKSILEVRDYWTHYDNANGFYINNALTFKKSLDSGTGSYRFDILIPRDVPNCNLDPTKLHYLVLVNTIKVAGYGNSPVYIKYLRVEF